MIDRVQTESQELQPWFQSYAVNTDVVYSCKFWP